MTTTNVFQMKEQTDDNHTNEKQLSFAERILKKHGWKSGNELTANDNITGDIQNTKLFGSNIPTLRGRRQTLCPLYTRPAHLAPMGQNLKN